MALKKLSKTPAPKKDKIYGSKVNKPKSASSSSAAKSISFSDSTLKAISNKVKTHNDSHPNKKVSINTAKAVVRRGMGAYSQTHRPTISGGKPNARVAWGLARLDAFLLKKLNKNNNPKYTQDNDLL
jgi:hypothetical protein